MGAVFSTWAESHAAIFISGSFLTVVALAIGFRLWRFKKRARDAARRMGSSESSFNIERFTIEVMLVAFVTAAIFAVAFGGYSVVRAVFASGHVEHCYVDTDDGVVMLYGYREWRPDHELGSFESAKRAAEVADTLGCELR